MSVEFKLCSYMYVGGFCNIISKTMFTRILCCVFFWTIKHLKISLFFSFLHINVLVFLLSWFTMRPEKIVFETVEVETVSETLWVLLVWKQNWCLQFANIVISPFALALDSSPKSANCSWTSVMFFIFQIQQRWQSIPLMESKFSLPKNV